MYVIKRSLEEKVAASLIPGKVVIIYGPRRSGKTLLTRQIVNKFPGRVLKLHGEDFNTQALIENRTVANYRHILGSSDQEFFSGVF